MNCGSRSMRFLDANKEAGETSAVRRRSYLGSDLAGMILAVRRYNQIFALRIIGLLPCGAARFALSRAESLLLRSRISNIPVSKTVPETSYSPQIAQLIVFPSKFSTVTSWATASQTGQLISVIVKAMKSGR